MKDVAKGVCASGLCLALFSAAAADAQVDSSTRTEVAFSPEAGAQDLILKTNNAYRKLHDKFMVVDGKHVQTDSYNYAASANRNSENVLVVWNASTLAQKYLQHWQSRFDEGSPYLPQ